MTSRATCRYHLAPMRLSRKLSALGAFFVLAIAVAGCGSGLPGDSVAIVDGNPITTQAFNHWMYVAAKGNASQSPGSPVIVPTDPPEFTACIAQVRQQIPTLAKTPTTTVKSDCAQLFTSLSSQVLDFLIKSYWYQGTAYKLHITPTSKQIAADFATARKAQFPTTTAFNAFLTETGQTLADITFRVRVNAIYKKLLAQDTQKITPASISAYYAAHQSQFSTPATRSIRIVRAKTESAVLAAKAALAAGHSWADVAKKYSIDTATKATGGLIANVTNGEEEKALNTAAFAAPLNQVTGPVHGTFGWYIVDVIKITPAAHESLAKETKLITQLLTSQNQSTATTAVDAAAKKRWGKQTTCRAAYAMADCNGYKAPTTTTTTPATSSTGTATASTGTTTAGTSTATTSAGTTTATVQTVTASTGTASTGTGTTTTGG